MAKVDILMATYNGSEYVNAQICSIVSQTYHQWRLLIHDDGSLDETVAIIRQWQKIDSRIKLIDDGIKCGGAASNFMHLVPFAEADYVMFADQDDIWFDNKVNVMVGALESKDNSKPQLLYTNLYVWLPKEGIEGYPVRTFPKDLKHFLFLNTGMHGCISIFNNCLLELMKQWKDKTIMHDQLLQLIGITLGEVEYLQLPLMLYRRHSNSVTGDTIVNLNDAKRIAASMEIPVLFEGGYNMIDCFSREYANMIKPKDIELLNVFLKMKNASTFNRLKSVITNGFKLYDSTFRLLIKILLRKYIA